MVFVVMCVNADLFSCVLYGCYNTQLVSTDKSDMAMPVSPMARPLTAPSRAPSSMAREVPIPCDADPNASPRAMGLVIPHLSSTHGPMRLPIIPVRNTTMAVMAGSPPNCSDRGRAMGIVADLGWSEAISFASRPKRCPNSITLAMPINAPVMVAIKMVISRPRKCSICSYNKYPNATTVGPNKKSRKAVPA